MAIGARTSDFIDKVSNNLCVDKVNLTTRVYKLCNKNITDIQGGWAARYKGILCMTSRI